MRELAILVIIKAASQIYTRFRPYVAPDYFTNSVVYAAYPELRSRHTDEGLLRLDAPDLTSHRGGVYFGDHMLHYHQLLRRGFAAHVNFDFAHTLCTYRDRHPDHLVSVAIDHTRLMPRREYSDLFELDYWFGPPLRLDRIDDPMYVGLTQHWRQPARPKVMYDQLVRTEFFWSSRNDLKTLQVEEIHMVGDQISLREGLVLNRYLHAQRDIARRGFIHMDGAVKIYETNHYEARYRDKMPGVDRGDYKVKLFRIDVPTGGREPISNDDWSKLTAFFFRGNEMVAEYLNPAWEQLLEQSRGR